VPRKIVELRRDGSARSAEELGEFNDLRRAAVLPAKGNPALTIEDEDVLVAGPPIGRLWHLPRLEEKSRK